VLVNRGFEEENGLKISKYLPKTIEYLQDQIHGGNSQQSLNSKSSIGSCSVHVRNELQSK